MTEAPKDQEVPIEDLSDDELQDASGGIRHSGWGDEDDEWMKPRRIN